MSLAFFVILFLFSPSSPLLIEEDYLSLSYQLLDAVKNKTSVESIKEKLAKVSLYELSEYLDNDTKRKTFWINIYNANIQLILSKSPELFEDRGKFFTKKLITIAQKEISFDDIEHGIIRGSKFKLALGLIKNPFPSNYEKQLRVKKLDPRIHFALNCGAKSCPEVALYKTEQFEKQIELISRKFLEATCNYDQKNDVVTVTPLFSWFRGDFGLKTGTKKILKQFRVIPGESNPRIKYGNYDWTLSLGNYVEYFN